MKALLTSSLGGYVKVDGTRVPAALIEENGLADRLRRMWTPNARVLIICSDPCNYEKNDDICALFRESFPMSGLSISSIVGCDDRNADAVEELGDVDVIVLAGGHIPTQNAFMKRLRLRERLTDYTGIVIGISAGSMNCADTVYVGPEREGEAVDPLFERWISGLGITDVNILPHFQSLKDVYLDGLRMVEDIAFADSMGHEILAINDGSYVLVDDGHETVYGRAYRIMDAQMHQLCGDNEAFVLK